jgi:hypothetical protein
MPIVPIPGITPPASAPGGTSSFPAVDIITMALQEIGAIAIDETPQASEAATGLAKFNRLVDAWNADSRYIYGRTFNQYTIVPNLQPHTVGPTGTFQTNQRPVKLWEANIILNSGTSPTQNIRYPMTVRDADWWANKRAYAVLGTLPTDVYYEPDFPNGLLFIWPVPSVAYLVELVTDTIINQVKLTDIISLPPGYLDALVYSLAISLVPSYEKQLDPALVELARMAIQRIQGPNTAAPRIGTKDAGIPSGRGQRASFNYLTGQSR